MTPSVAAVIPARYDSTRFPGKPLAILAGKPMIQWVWERTCELSVDQVLVATDDPRIRDCVAAFGGKVAMTSRDHPTGTDRIAAAVRDCPVDIVINVQGDEPLLSVALVNRLIAEMRADSTLQMGTVAVPLGPSSDDFHNPNVVKVVTDAQSNALYFSRSAIPYDRDGAGSITPLRHWGVYAFRKEFLHRFIAWPQGALEQIEKLEQLRALEHGARIRVIVGQENIPSIGIDTPEDLRRAESMLRNIIQP